MLNYDRKQVEKNPDKSVLNEVRGNRSKKITR